MNEGRRLRILFVTNMCTHYTRPLFEELARQYEVDFYFTGGHEHYWHKANELPEGDFHGQYLPGFFVTRKLKITPALLRLPMAGFDVVIKTMDDRFALLVTFVLAKIRRTPFVLWTGLWTHPRAGLHRFTFGLTKFIYRHADGIIAYGGHVRTYLIGLGIEERKIFCAAHVTDNGRYDRVIEHKEKLALKQELGIDPSQKVILYVGRLEEGKGLSFLIAACAALKAMTYVLVLIGTGSQRQLLQHMCVARNIPCRFAEHVPNEDLCRYYALADIFVLPSVTTPDFKEPWGMVINEAMNQGCPVVVTSAVGAAAGGLVEDGKTGFIVREADSGQLARALETLLNNDILRQAMAGAARGKIKAWTPRLAVSGFAQAIDWASKNDEMHP